MQFSYLVFAAAWHLLIVLTSLKSLRQDSLAFLKAAGRLTAKTADDSAGFQQRHEGE